MTIWLVYPSIIFLEIEVWLKVAQTDVPVTVDFSAFSRSHASQIQLNPKT